MVRKAKITSALLQYYIVYLEKEIVTKNYWIKIFAFSHAITNKVNVIIAITAESVEGKRWGEESAPFIILWNEKQLFFFFLFVRNTGFVVREGARELPSLRFHVFQIRKLNNIAAGPILCFASYARRVMKYTWRGELREFDVRMRD